MSRHSFAHDSDVRVCNRSLVNDASSGHDEHTIGERQKFVEVLADQKDRHTLIAGREDLRMDEVDGGEIQPKAGIGCDQNLRGSIREVHGFRTVAIARGREKEKLASEWVRTNTSTAPPMILRRAFFRSTWAPPPLRPPAGVRGTFPAEHPSMARENQL